jgi:anti-sigma regulatory factor (Ser/Thr protein kinase)
MTEAADQPIVIIIDEPSKAGEARRLAKAMSERLGFDETNCGKAAIVVTEAATNLHKHAQHGEIILQGFLREGTVGLEILALDKGPGMTDVGRCMADGFSTAGSPGNGLGAMSRLSRHFEIHSSIDYGTVAVARLWQGPPPSREDPAFLEVGVVNLPMAGEDVCGDAWAVKEAEGRTVVMIADGLGHGLLAAEASREAVESFRKNSSLSTEQILRTAHDLLRKTRGAAMAVTLIDSGLGEARFCGIGNISGVILSPKEARSASMVSHNGTVGHTIRKVQEFVYPWSSDSLLIMHSDGLATHWNLDRYPGLMAQHPSLISSVLYRDFSRKRDDVTVLVGRERSAFAR